MNVATEMSQMKSGGEVEAGTAVIGIVLVSGLTETETTIGNATGREGARVRDTAGSEVRVVTATATVTARIESTGIADGSATMLWTTRQRTARSAREKTTDLSLRFRLLQPLQDCPLLLLR